MHERTFLRSLYASEREGRFQCSQSRAVNSRSHCWWSHCTHLQVVVHKICEHFPVFSVYHEFRDFFWRISVAEIRP